MLKGNAKQKVAGLSIKYGKQKLCAALDKWKWQKLGLPQHVYTKGKVKGKKQGVTEKGK